MSEAKTLAHRLLLSRRDSNLDQKELGRRANVSNGYISDIEHGKVTNVGIEVISSLAKALEISTAYLIGLTDDPYGGIPDSALEVERTQFDALTQELINLFQQLSPPQQATLLNIAKVIRASDEAKIIGG